MEWACSSRKNWSFGMRFFLEKLIEYKHLITILTEFENYCHHFENKKNWLEILPVASNNVFALS